MQRGEYMPIDTKEWAAFYKKLDKLEGSHEAFFRQTSQNVAARMLSLVIPKTPVYHGVYSDGRLGGTLRRGWTCNTHDEAMSTTTAKDPTSRAKELQVHKSGDEYTIDVTNPVHYAPYVEYGHRLRGGSGWVVGQFFLTNSEHEMQAMLPKIVNKQLDKWIEKNMR